MNKLKLSNHAYELMEPLIPELKQFYKVINGEKMGLVELAICIEQQFGARISELVCKEAKISDAACLVLAIGMLRPVGPAMIKTAKEICHEQNC